MKNAIKIIIIGANIINHNSQPQYWIYSLFQFIHSSIVSVRLFMQHNLKTIFPSFYLEIFSQQKVVQKKIKKKKFYTNSISNTYVHSLSHSLILFLRMLLTYPCTHGTCFSYWQLIFFIIFATMYLPRCPLLHLQDVYIMFNKTFQKH